MNDTIFFILQCIYLMLPGILANSAPVIFKNSFKELSMPVDFGKKWRGKELFGSHKTYRGFVVGTISGALIGLLQMSLYDFDFFRTLSLYDYSLHPILFGTAIGFGALFGDLIKSFFKRRLNIKSGERWFPFDEIDAFVGAAIFMIPFYIMPIKVLLTILVLTIIIHMTTNHIAYWIGLKETRW